MASSSFFHALDGLRDFLAASRGMLDEAFPIPGTIALARLKDGLDPGASSIILI